MPVFRLANGAVVEVPYNIVDQYITTELSNCFDTRCYMDSDDVMSCLAWLAGEKNLEPGTAKKCVQHMLFYAENFLLTVYMYVKASEPGLAEEKRKHDMEVLSNARVLAREAEELLSNGDREAARRKAQHILRLLLGYGVDPW